MSDVFRDEYEISTDRSRLNLDAIHAYLARSYWSPGVAFDIVKRAVENSLCFGLFNGAAQIGLARVITDMATFAYLADVYVLEAHRGKGLSKWLVETVRSHPDLQGLRRFLLVTRDAHGLYRQFGFTALSDPARFMEVGFAAAVR